MVRKVGEGEYRSFTIVEVSKHGGCKTKFKQGRYISKTPAGAAMKAFNAHCRKKRIRGVCTLVVTLKETTSGKGGKLFSYKLKRRKLAEPVIRLEGTPNEFVIEYKPEAKSVKVPESCRKPGQTRGRMLKRTIKRNRQSANNVRRKMKVVKRASNHRNNSHKRKSSKKSHKSKRLRLKKRK